MGCKRCLQSLRDAIGAQTPYLRYRGFHMAACGCVRTGERINTSKTENPGSKKRYRGFLFWSLAMTYSHMGIPHTTIGDASFHF